MAHEVVPPPKVFGIFRGTLLHSLILLQGTDSGIAFSGLNKGETPRTTLGFSL